MIQDSGKKGAGMKCLAIFCGIVAIVMAAAVWFGMPQASAVAMSNPAEAPTFLDEFSSVTLNPVWSWVRQDNTHWSLTSRPGYMRLVTEQGGLLGSGNNKNLLLRTPPSGRYAITTRVIYKPDTNFQNAGLLVYQDDDNFLWLGRGYCDFPHCKGNAIYFDHGEGGSFVGSNFGTAVTNKRNAYLKIERRGLRYIGFYSADGVNWTRIGKHVVSDTFAPKVGIATGDGNQGAPQRNADFDFFRMVKLP
jgi:beta-xylosidase